MDLHLSLFFSRPKNAPYLSGERLNRRLCTFFIPSISLFAFKQILPESSKYPENIPHSRKIKHNVYINPTHHQPSHLIHIKSPYTNHSTADKQETKKNTRPRKQKKRKNSQGKKSITHPQQFAQLQKRGTPPPQCQCPHSSQSHPTQFTGMIHFLPPDSRPPLLPLFSFLFQHSLSLFFYCNLYCTVQLLLHN